MKKHLITTLLLVLTIYAHAQIGVVALKEYADFKKRTLLVIVEEQNQKLMSKLTPEQQEIYKQEIEEYNTLVKWAMETYYKVGNVVEYKSRTEVQKVIDNRDRKFTYLEFTKFTDNYLTKTSFDLVQKNRLAKDQTRLSGAISLNSIVSAINIRFPEVVEGGLPFYGQYLPNPFPDKADIAYAFNQIASTLAYRENGITYDKVEDMDKENGQKLKSLTLLIAEDEIDPKEDRDKFFKAYEQPMQVVTREKIKEAILANDAKYACVITVPTYDREDDQVKFEFQVYDCGKGITLITSKPQDKAGLSVGPMVGLKNLKKATDSKLPPVRKENLWDFARYSK